MKIRCISVLFFVPLLMISLFTLSGCSTSNGSAPAHDLAMADMAMMPMDVKAAPVVVQEAYQFAVANPHVLQQLPCYCGCGKAGHRSNYACYVSATDATKGIAFDSHALGCSICVDITQDAMRLTREGRDIRSIRAYIDQTYSRYGPSNMPPP